jgi:spore coat protein CotH
MNVRRRAAVAVAFFGCLLLLAPQASLSQPEPKKGGFEKKEGGFGKGGPGGFGGMMGQTRKVVKLYDKDADGRLNAEERQVAREALNKQGGGRTFGKGPGGFGKGGEEPAKPGAKVSPADVKSYPNAPLYDATVLRTLFLDFENKDWEAELADFKGTDVEVPATLTVDGKKYTNVGVHFRGMSSYMGVGAGYKRSLNLSMDFVNAKQRLYGHRTLNLLNSHEDASFMSSILYSQISRQYLPTPKANFVKVVINGESWGVYANVQQFNKEFLKENFKTDSGARWKVSGSPGGGGGLEYTGDNLDDYKRCFEIKSKDDEKSWKALVNLCKVLNQTPAEKLEEALKPIMDIDSLLWFLALDISLINCDGYWIRASDYSLYLDPKGKFHVIPSDMNEAFRPGGGPGFGGPGGGRPGGGGGFFVQFPMQIEAMPARLQDALGLTEAQRKEFEKLQKELEEKVGKILTAEQNKQLKDLRDRPIDGVGLGDFGPPGGMGPGGMGGGVDLDPLNGLVDMRKPLRSKVLAVPSLRAKYLQNVKTIAEKSLDWKTLGPVVAQYRALIEKEVEADTRKLSSFDAFKRMTADDVAIVARGREIPLRAFADQRRKYLIDYKEPKLAQTTGTLPPR